MLPFLLRSDERSAEKQKERVIQQLRWEGISGPVFVYVFKNIYKLLQVNAEIWQDGGYCQQIGQDTHVIK